MTSLSLLLAKWDTPLSRACRRSASRFATVRPRYSASARVCERATWVDTSATTAAFSLRFKLKGPLLVSGAVASRWPAGRVEHQRPDLQEPCAASANPGRVTFATPSSIRRDRHLRWLMAARPA